MVFADHLTTVILSLGQRYGSKDVQERLAKIFADIPAAAQDLDSVKIAAAFEEAIQTLLDPKSVPRGLPVVLDGKWIRIGRHFSVCFRRTLRIPEDGKDYPLPPGFSRFPICKVEDTRIKFRRIGWKKAASLFQCISAKRCIWNSEVQIGGLLSRKSASARSMP